MSAIEHCQVYFFIAIPCNYYLQYETLYEVRCLQQPHLRFFTEVKNIVHYNSIYSVYIPTVLYQRKQLI